MTLRKITHSLQCFWRDDSASTAAEYALLLGLVCCVIVGAVGLLGTQIKGLFNAFTAGYH